MQCSGTARTDENARTDDAKWHVALRVLGFLTSGRDSFKTDLGEVDDRCGTHDAVDTEFADAGVFRDKGRPVLRHQFRQVGQNDVSADQNK